jgi:hypothetical protein
MHGVLLLVDDKGKCGVLKVQEGDKTSKSPFWKVTHIDPDGLV